jgi:hypothetical protein
MSAATWPIQSRRSLRNWSRPVILYPFLTAVLLAAFGGGYETIREAMDKAAHSMSVRCDRALTRGREAALTCGYGGPPQAREVADLGTCWWALEDLNLRPLPCQGKLSQAVTSVFAAQATCGLSQEFRLVPLGSVGSLTWC